jgi:1,5-anhydro-D-fructose reductase (1,5-anhydro-D-mannitol-forming)
VPTPLRIGLVGAGRILPAHLRGYQLLRQAGVDSFRITALTSRNPADAESFPMRGHGPPPRPPVSSDPNDPLAVPHLYVSDFQDDVDARVYDSLDAMLQDDVVDALDISASLPVHHSAALAGIRRGKHCLVQKPFAITVAAGRAMVEAARQHGVSLGVAENLRYAPASRIARWLIDAGLLGEVQMCARWGIGTREWSPDRIVAQTPWRHRKLEAGAGAALDIGVHLMHQLRYLGGEIESVSGSTRIFEPVRYTRADGTVVDRVECTVDDAFFATVRFRSGGLGQLAFSWAGHGPPTAPPEGLVVYGARGCLKGDQVYLDEGGRHSAEELFRARAEPATVDRFFPLGLRDTFALGALDFLDAIAAHRDPEASGVEGLHDLAAAFAICESSELGHAVPLDAVLDGSVKTYQAEIDRHYGF